MQPISAPVSVGELLDKITILEIKAKRISDETKLSHVRKELNLLLEVCKKHHIDTQTQSVAELRQHNQTLWDIEDAIREKEKKQEFDENFITLARLVYKTNDLRAKVKKDINVLTKSDLLEEKSY